VHGRRKAEIVARAEQTVATALAGLDTDGLDLRVVVTTDAPARALIERSAFADLLVVSSHGRGGFQGLVLGSVSLQCARHARCPVTVVRPELASRDADAGRSASGVCAGSR
jgi:nucleotide-binding universal stress UspA family protein